MGNLIVLFPALLGVVMLVGSLRFLFKVSQRTDLYKAETLRNKEVQGEILASLTLGLFSAIFMFFTCLFIFPFMEISEILLFIAVTYFFIEGIIYVIAAYYPKKMIA